VRVIPRVLIAAALAFGSGCARTDWIDRTLVTENVTGVWFGSIGGRANVQLELQHQGPKVTGFVRFGGSPTPIEGSVAGDVFTFKNARGSFSGELTVGGDEMTGRFFDLNGTRQISLRRANPPEQPNPPTR
jgi:hypothetical protein